MYKRQNNENPSEENSADESGEETNKFLTAPISGSYGSTSVQDESVPRFYVPCCGLVFYVMAFFGVVSILILRECLSVAVVAMVNQTAVADEDIVVTNVTDDQCPKDPELQSEGGEFNWDRNQQGILLAAFYYGYGVTKIPGGWMADRFGGKWLIGGSILLSSVIALLTPTAARIHIVLLIIIRVLSGLGEGVIFPAIHAMIARWSAPKYHSAAVSVIYAGGNVGIITGLLLTGVLCDYGFAGGWPSAFYVFGLFGCVWSIAWFLLCYNSPSDHPRISVEEKKYWETVIGATDLVAHPPTPWREILTSVPVWALAVTYFAHIWGSHSLMNCLPLFMHDVLGFNSSNGGIFSAVPFLASSVMLPLSGLSADWLRAPGRLSTNSVRKIFCAAGFTLSGCFLILVSYMGCNRALAIATMSAAVVTLYPIFSTVLVNQLDLAPLHAGKIMGLTYTVANLGSVFGTHAVSELTYGNSTRSAWQNVFFLTAAVYAVGAVVFVIFGSGHRQRWAGDTSHHEVVISLDRNKENLSDKEQSDLAKQNVN